MQTLHGMEECCARWGEDFVCMVQRVVPWSQICKEVCKHYRCTIASYLSCPAILAQVLGTHLSQNRARRDELFCSSRFLPPTLPCKMTACSSLGWLLCSALAWFAHLGPPASRTSHRRDARWFLLRTEGGTSIPIAIVSRWWDDLCRAELLLKVITPYLNLLYRCVGSPNLVRDMHWP